MRLRLFTIILLLLALFPLCVSAAGKDPARQFEEAKAALTRLDKSKGVQRTYRERWIEVIDRFETFSARNRRHPLAAEALFLAARSSEKMAEISRLDQDVEAAREAYQTVADQAPRSPFAADGLWAGARLSEKRLDDPSGAYRLYARLVNDYAQDRHAKEARQAMARLARFAPAKSTDLRATGSKETDRVKSGMLTAIRSWSNPGYTRIVIDLSQSTKYSTTLLPGDESTSTPTRLFLDFVDTAPIGGLSELSIVNDGLLRQIRTGRPTVGRTRVVLDLLSYDNYKIFALPEPFRVVIDISGKKPVPAPSPVIVAPIEPLPIQSVRVTATAPVEPPVAAPASSASAASPSPVAIPALPPPVPTVAVLSSPAPQQTDPIAAIVAQAPAEEPTKKVAPRAPLLPGHRIVIDAGHGGKDPGAIGPSGLQEKDIVLAMALTLADEVRSELGWEVVLTRSDDTFIPLEERTAIANKVNADLFLSVHANASPNAAAHGIETYYLNFSKNEKAAAVAARENGTSLREVSDLEQILFDLMAHSKIQESSRLASDIQNALVDKISRQYGEVKNLGVKQGPFYVLLGANMPSVLVEAAFISNPGEETRLASRRYQKEATRAIIAGLRAYAGNTRMVARQ